MRVFETSELNTVPYGMQSPLKLQMAIALEIEGITVTFPISVEIRPQRKSNTDRQTDQGSHLCQHGF